MTQIASIPDDLYQRLRDTATAPGQPIEEISRRVLTRGLPPRPVDVPESDRDELRRSA